MYWLRIKFLGTGIPIISSLESVMVCTWLTSLPTIIHGRQRKTTRGQSGESGWVKVKSLQGQGLLLLVVMLAMVLEAKSFESV